MHPWLRVTAQWILLSLALVGAGLGTCVGDHIPPSIFQFQNVVPHPPPPGAGGGWKVAQATILLSRLSPHFPAAASCDIEVGVPEKNGKGWVPDEFAQAAAARAANEAARLVLRERLPTALACKQFREQMERVLTDKATGPIPGANVSGFIEVGVPRRTFQ
ncbi:hypothetical protein [Archangium violaceum]|uniref:hypothetical protein n=1 Tax=Archangium violaceum TaxID=83451 RepID=UPI0036DC2E63